MTPSDLGKIGLKKTRPENGRKSSEYQSRHVRGPFTPGFPFLQFVFYLSTVQRSIPLNKGVPIIGSGKNKCAFQKSFKNAFFFSVILKGTWTQAIKNNLYNVDVF